MPIQLYQPRNYATGSRGFGAGILDSEEDSKPLDLKQFAKASASAGLSGLSAVGNFLDLPGSVVRDLMTWVPGGIEARNPFDQLIPGNLTSSENRTTGEELLISGGLLRKNKSKSSLVNAGRFAAGIALEVLTDPLTPLTAGVGAFGKAGKLVQKAGLGGDVVGAATEKLAKQAGRPITRRVGPREAAMLVTPDEVAKFSRSLDPAKRADSYTEASNRLFDANRGQALGKLSDTPLAQGPLRYHIPGVVDVGFGGKNIARAQDMVGDAVRFGKYSPVRMAAPFVSKAVRGAWSGPAQRKAIEKHRYIEETYARARDTMTGYIRQIHDSGLLGGDDKKKIFDNSQLMRQYLEGTIDPAKAKDLGLDIFKRDDLIDAGRGDVWDNYFSELDDTTKDTLDGLKGEMDSIIKEAKDNGINVSELKDDFAEYFTRVKTSESGLFRSKADKRYADPQDQFATARKDFLRNIPGGTAKIQMMSVDDRFAGKLDTRFFGPGKDKKTKDALYNEFLEAYEMDDTGHAKQLFTAIAGRSRKDVDNMVPMFGMNPAEAALKRMESSLTAQAQANTMRELIKETAKRLENPEWNRFRKEAVSAFGTGDEVMEELARAKSHGQLFAKVTGKSEEEFWTRLNARKSTLDDLAANIWTNGPSVVTPEMKGVLKEMGYDADQIRAMDPKAAWRMVRDSMDRTDFDGDEILYQTGSIGPRWHSKLKNAVDERSFPKGIRRDDLVKVMEKAGKEGKDPVKLKQGILKDMPEQELKNLELDILFDGRDVVPRDEFKQWVEMVNLPIIEHRLGPGQQLGADDLTARGWKEVEVKDDNGVPYYGYQDDLGVMVNEKMAPSKDEALKEASNAAGFREKTGYAAYSAPRKGKGGDNYREILLAMPNRAEHFEKQLQKLSSEGRGQDDSLYRAVERLATKYSEPEYRDYTAGHWEQPNVFVHLRVSDHVGPGGKKILFVEEIQSDANQKGFTQGWADETAAEAKQYLDKARDRKTGMEKDLLDLRKQASALRSKAAKDGTTDEIKKQMNDIEEKMFELEESIDVASQNISVRSTHFMNREALEAGKTRTRDNSIARISGVPSNPFKQTYPEVAIKRAAREAAEGGYDSLVISGFDSVKSLQMGGVKSGLKNFYEEVYPNLLNKVAKPWKMKADKMASKIIPISVKKSEFAPRYGDPEDAFAIEIMGKSGNSFAIGPDGKILKSKEAAESLAKRIEQDPSGVLEEYEILGGKLNDEWEEIESELTEKYDAWDAKKSAELEEVLAKYNAADDLVRTAESKRVRTLDDVMFDINVSILEKEGRAPTEKEMLDMLKKEKDSIPTEKEVKDLVAKAAALADKKTALEREMSDAYHAVNYRNYETKFGFDAGDQAKADQVLKLKEHQGDAFYTLGKLMEAGEMQGVSGKGIEIPPGMREDILRQGMSLYQEGEGGRVLGAAQFYPGKAIIVHALPDANLTTFSHEMGHVFRRSIADFDPGLIADAEKHFGVSPGAAWTKAQEEKFADAYVAYTQGGKTPTGIRKYFEAFTEWLKGIWSTISESDIPGKMDPDLRKFFDRVVGPDIKDTQKMSNRTLDEILKATKFGHGGGMKKVIEDLGDRAADVQLDAVERQIAQQNQRYVEEQFQATGRNVPLADARIDAAAQNQKITGEEFNSKLLARLAKKGSYSGSAADITAQWIKDGVVDANGKVNRRKLMQESLRRGALNADGTTIDGIRIPSYSETLHGFGMPDEIAADITRLQENRPFAEILGDGNPASVALALYDKFLDTFKTHVTATNPGFHVRNFVSGFIQNSMNGVYDPTQANPIKRYTQPYFDGGNLITGAEVEGAENIPIIKRAGLKGKAATKRLQDLTAMYGLMLTPGQHRDVVATSGGSTFMSIPGIKQLEGNTLGGRLFSYTKAKAKARGNKAAMPIEFARSIGDVVEAGHRVGGFIALLKQGYDPAEAARRIKLLQVDYSNLSHTEREVLRRVFPFYSYARGMIEFIGKDLSTKPGGFTAIATKAAARATESDAAVPDYVSKGISFPLGEGEDGSKSYVTGLGLMHEAPMNLLPMGIQSGLFNLASQANPIPKGLVELATNRSLFQTSPEGGRSLDDLDPLIGRTLSNVGNALGLTDRKTPVRVGKLTEAIASNSPVSRYLSTTRTMFDPRKTWTQSLLSTGTGLRISTISPAAQDAVLRERAQTIMRDLGGRVFERPYIPEDVFNDMGPQDQKKALEYMELMKELGRRSKARSAEKELPATGGIQLLGRGR